MKGRPSLYQGKDNAAAADVEEGVRAAQIMLPLFHASPIPSTTILSKDFRPVPLCRLKRKGPFSLSQILTLSI